MQSYTQSYIYDAGTNLVALKHQGSSEQRQYQPVREANNRQQTHQYDPVGNQLSHESLDEMVYNSDGQLAYVTWQNGGYSCKEYYTYGSPGVRARKVTEVRTLLTGALVRLETVHYVGDVEFRATYTGTAMTYDGDTVTNYNQVDTRTVTRIKAGHGQVGKITAHNGSDTITYNALNHLDSNELELDESAQLAHYRQYAPYGETLSEEKATDNTSSELGYSGQEEDESGLVYYGYRYYQQNGVWNRADPIRFKSGQLNLYNLVNGNPVTSRDEWGLFPGENDYTIQLLIEGYLEEVRQQSIMNSRAMPHDIFTLVNKFYDKSEEQLTPLPEEENDHSNLLVLAAWLDQGKINGFGEDTKLIDLLEKTLEKRPENQKELKTFQSALEESLVGRFLIDPHKLSLRYGTGNTLNSGSFFKGTRLRNFFIQDIHDKLGYVRGLKRMVQKAFETKPKKVKIWIENTGEQIETPFFKSMLKVQQKFKDKIQKKEEENVYMNFNITSETKGPKRWVGLIDTLSALNKKYNGKTTRLVVNFFGGDNHEMTELTIHKEILSNTSLDEFNFVLIGGAHLFFTNKKDHLNHFGRDHPTSAYNIMHKLMTTNNKYAGFVLPMAKPYYPGIVEQLNDGKKYYYAHKEIAYEEESSTSESMGRSNKNIVKTYEDAQEFTHPPRFISPSGVKNEYHSKIHFPFVHDRVALIQFIPSKGLQKSWDDFDKKTEKRLIKRREKLEKNVKR